MRKPITFLFIATVVGAGVVFFLYLLSNQRQHSGDFYRVFPTHPVIPLDKAIVEAQYNYFAGAADTAIVLGSTRDPLNLMRLSDSELDTTSSTISLGPFGPITFTSIVVKVDSTNFYLLDGSQPFVFHGSTSDWTVTESMMKGLFFKDVIPLGNASFAISAVNVSAYENVLAKKIGDRSPAYNGGLLQKQVDGIFCTDGMLHYSEHLNELIYLYYYRNQYIIADTNLVLKSRHNTIDTFSHAQIKSTVLSYKTQKSFQLAAPPMSVNRRSYCYKHWFFVISNVEALNEIKDLFNNSSVVDVYDLNMNAYAFSFYLPDEGDKLKHILVRKEKLFVPL